jgi:protein gp37
MKSFEEPVFNSHRMDQPLNVKKPSGIFLDSMSDLMGSWVSEEEVQNVLDVCRKAHWHTFFLLTKNAPRLSKFKFPTNVLVGVSMPPTIMFGKVLSTDQQNAYMHKALDILSEIDARTWISFEPLSFDVAPIVEDYPNAIEWAVIGAASSGKKYYQPDPQHFVNLLSVLDGQDIPVYFKENIVWHFDRKEFPAI